MTMKNQKYPFHISLPCENIESTKEFYVGLLNARTGRESSSWLDIDLYGHQLTFTEAGEFNFMYRNYRLGNQMLPSFHFGVILPKEEWSSLKNSITSKGVDLSLESTFFMEKTGEQMAFLLPDPNGYMIEFKCFSNEEEVFES